MKAFFLIALVALVPLMFTPIVSALTEEGQISYEALTESTSVTTSIAGGSLSFNHNFNISCANAATINGLQYLVYYSPSGLTYDAGKTSGQTRFTSSYGDGWIGYNIITGANGFVFVQFDEPIQTVGSSFISFNLVYDYTYFNNLGCDRGPVAAVVQDSLGVNMAYLARNTAPSIPLSQYGGKYFTNIINKKFKHEYDVTLDEDTNIVTGNIIRNVDGYAYPSIFYIYDVTNSLIISDNTYQSFDLPFMVFKHPLKLCFKDVYNNWHNTSLLLNLPPDYVLSVSPSSGTINTNFTADSVLKSGGVISGLSAFTVICTSGQVSGKCLSNGTDPAFIKKSDNYWYQGSTKLSTAFPASIPLVFDSPGSYVVDAYYYPADLSMSGTTARDYVNITSSTGTVKLTIQVKDTASNGFVAGSTVQIIDPWGVWSNETTDSGIRDIFVQKGTTVGYGATAPGFYESSIVYSKIEGDITKTISLNPIAPVSAGNNTLYVYVRDARSLDGIEGVLIHLNDGQTKSTPGSGVASFTVLENGTYSITASKTGFNSVTRSLMVSGSANSISMELSPIYVTTARTLAPGETATLTPIPTVDTRTNEQKGQDIIKFIYDNGEGIVGFCLLLFFIGGFGMMSKSWK